MDKPKNLATLLADAPRDKWLALSDDETRVVGAGDTVEAAVSQAAQNGVADPILVLAPPQWGFTVL